MKQQVVHRDAVTHTQLSSLLGAAATMHGMFVSMTDTDGSGITDGGARMAIETTLVEICNRIGDIIGDKQRWSLDSQNSLEASLIEAHVAIRRANEMAAAPHMRFKPKLAQLSDGMWIAFLGDINDLGNAILGLGENPAAAVKAFDMVFEGQVPEHLMKWIQEKQNNESQQNEKNLDTGGIDSTTNTKIDGSLGERNGRDSGEDDQGGPSPTGTDTGC